MAEKKAASNADAHLEVSARGHGEGTDEFLKVDGAVLVGVKDIKHIVRKRRRVAKGEEMLVNLLELLLVEQAAGTICCF